MILNAHSEGRQRQIYISQIAMMGLIIKISVSTTLLHPRQNAKYWNYHFILLTFTIAVASN